MSQGSTFCAVAVKLTSMGSPLTAVSTAEKMTMAWFSPGGERLAGEVRSSKQLEQSVAATWPAPRSHKCVEHRSQDVKLRAPLRTAGLNPSRRRARSRTQRFKRQKSREEREKQTHVLASGSIATDLPCRAPALTRSNLTGVAATDASTRKPRENRRRPRGCCPSEHARGCCRSTGGMCCCRCPCRPRKPAGDRWKKSLATLACYFRFEARALSWWANARSGPSVSSDGMCTLALLETLTKGGEQIKNG